MKLEKYRIGQMVTFIGDFLQYCTGKVIRDLGNSVEVEYTPPGQKEKQKTTIQKRVLMDY